MMETVEKKLVLMPDAAYARRQVLYNASWFGLLMVLAVMVLMILIFPKFFFYLLPRYYKVLFQSGTAAHAFFFKVFFSFAFIFISAAGSRYVSIYGLWKKKEIFVSMDQSGIASHFGIMKQKILWKNYKGIATTDFPSRMYISKRKLMVHSAFNADKLRGKISEFKKTLA